MNKFAPAGNAGAEHPSSFPTIMISEPGLVLVWYQSSTMPAWSSNNMPACSSNNNMPAWSSNNNRPPSAAAAGFAAAVSISYNTKPFTCG